jgi:zinc protease
VIGWADQVRAVSSDEVRDAARKWLDRKRSVTGYLVKDTSGKVEEKRS